MESPRTPREGEADSSTGPVKINLLPAAAGYAWVNARPAWGAGYANVAPEKDPYRRVSALDALPVLDAGFRPVEVAPTYRHFGPLAPKGRGPRSGGKRGACGARAFPRPGASSEAVRGVFATRGHRDEYEAG